MRIAWFVYGDLAQPTGGYVYDRIVVEGLRAAGDDVAVLDPRGPAPAATADARVGDALCVPELGARFEQPGRAARILLVHHMPSWEIERTDREPLRRLEARALAASDAAIATSERTAERLRAEAPSLPVAVVVPGADRWPRRARAEAEGAGLRLLFVGSWIPRKRIELLLDALECVADRRVSLTLVGDAGRDPPYAQAIAARVNASPCRGRIELRGVIGDEALARAMECADALVLPSSLEGYGMVLTEALHAGTPVLASRAAAAAANIVEGVGARVFEDAAGLAGILAELASDPRARAALRRSAGSLALPRWADAVAAFRAAIVARVSA